MRITIGELVDELIPYSNVVDASVMNGVPFVRALLSSGSNYTKAYLYIVQIKEHVYSAIDDYDDLAGRRFFPTGNPNKAFVQEIDVIHFMFGGESHVRPSGSSINEAGYYTMLDHIYDRLVSYGCIRFSPNSYAVKFSDMGFTNVKIRRVIDKAFAGHGVRNGTIRDLVDIVNKHHKKFSLSTLRPRDIQCIVAKLKDLGVILDLEDDHIIHVLFDRKCWL